MVWENFIYVVRYRSVTTYVSGGLRATSEGDVGLGYRSLLLTRWSSRDWLAVLVVGVTVAFLTGTALLLGATSAQTTAIAAEFDSPGNATYYDDPEVARTAAGEAGTVLPVAEVTNGSTRTLLVGVPDGLDAELDRENRRFRFASGNTTTLGTIGTARTERLDGPDDAITVTVQPRNRRATLLASAWYVTNPETVEQMGVSGAFVVRIGTDTPGGHDDGSVPLISALQFFLLGTGEVLRTFGAAATGAAVLVGVTVFSVSRMSVRDRLSTIRIVRSTGGRPRTVLGLFAIRAALLTLVGVSLGYATGVIVTNTAVNLAVAVGLPTSLSLEPSPRGVRVLGLLYVAIVGVGGIGGLLAAWPAAHRPPGHLTGEESARERASPVPDVLAPSLLHWRAFIPTTAALTTFVAFVVLVSSMAAVAGPVVTAEGTTITQPGSIHPIASKVPEAYADALQARDINASAEILLFEMSDGQPLLARGVEYDDFERVTDARLVRGRAPTGSSEALVGADLARARGVEIGDTITLGGSTEASLTRVEVVGAFSAPGPFDDQLLVSLSTARHLEYVSSDAVQLVRAERLPSAPSESGPDETGRGDATGTGIGVVDLTIDGPVTAHSSFTADVTLRNDGPRTARASVPVEFDGDTRNVTTEIDGGRQRTVRVEFTAGAPGDYTLRAGNVTSDVRVIDPASLHLDGLPARAPPGSNPLVTVTNGTGAPVTGANVTVGNRTVTTDGDGRVRVPLTTTGRVEITVVHRGENVTDVVSVTSEATRSLTTSLGVHPSEPSLTTRPEVRLALGNPWNESVNATVRIDGPGGSFERAVVVEPGRQTVVSTRLAQQPPGSNQVRASLDGRTVETVEYRVTGDQRIVSALATTGGDGETGISQSIEVLFGNLQLLVGTLLGLAAFMTVGGTTATFAQAVYARRRTIGIYRATGASPGCILRLVLADTVRIGAIASLAALVLALLALRVLDAVGYLTLFGVSLQPTPSPAVAVGIVVGSLCVTLLGATIATLGLLRPSPASLLSGKRSGLQSVVGNVDRSGDGRA